MKWLKWLVLMPVMGLVVFNIYAYGSILFWRSFAPESTAFMRARMDELAVSKPEVNLDYQWVPYHQISKNLKQALIASEDANFANHDGFDWKGIQAAMKRNERSGKVRAGGSTISQQLAKNLFLWEKRSYFRKAEEAAITLMIEGTTDKDRIFEIYLNVIEWGYGIYGAEAASQNLFKKSASHLNRQQAAQLASRVTRPLYYVDHPNDRGLRRKTNIILRRMGAATLPE